MKVSTCLLAVAMSASASAKSLRVAHNGKAEKNGPFPLRLLQDNVFESGLVGEQQVEQQVAEIDSMCNGQLDSMKEMMDQVNQEMVNLMDGYDGAFFLDSSTMRDATCEAMCGTTDGSIEESGNGRRLFQDLPIVEIMSSIQRASLEIIGNSDVFQTAKDLFESFVGEFGGDERGEEKAGRVLQTTDDLLASVVQFLMDLVGSLVTMGQSFEFSPEAFSAMDDEGSASSAQLIEDLFDMFNREDLFDLLQGNVEPTAFHMTDPSAMPKTVAEENWKCFIEIAQDSSKKFDEMSKSLEYSFCSKLC